jgi:hypothetical protein
VRRLIRQPATPVNREIAGARARPALFPPRPVNTGAARPGTKNGGPWPPG